jgi:hypothetical protein
LDAVPEARLYRDYIIDAFNRDMPYDQFVREQFLRQRLLQANDFGPAPNCGVLVQSPPSRGDLQERLDLFFGFFGL